MFIFVINGMTFLIATLAHLILIRSNLFHGTKCWTEGGFVVANKTGGGKDKLDLS